MVKPLSMYLVLTLGEILHLILIPAVQKTT